MIEQTMAELKKALDNPIEVLHKDHIEATIRRGDEWAQLTASGHIISFLAGDDKPYMSDCNYGFAGFIEVCKEWNLIERA